MAKLLRYLIVTAVCCLAALSSAGERQSWLLEGSQHQRVGVQVKVERFSSAAAAEIKVAGFDFVRLGVWTNSMRDPAYRRLVESAFANAQSVGLPVLTTVRSTVALATGARSDSERGAMLQLDATRMADVIAQLARQHAGNLLAVEIWNEPELPKYWPTGDVDVTFAPYMRAVCKRLSATRLSVPIIGFGFARPPIPAAMSYRLLQQLKPELARCVSAISYHAYGVAPMQIRDADNDIQGRFGLPAVVTEWGAPSLGSNGATSQATRLAAFLKSSGTMATALVSIYEWQDTVTGPSERERNFGLVDALGLKKPALGAVAGVLRAR